MKRFLLGLAVASWGLVSVGAANAATFVFDVSVDERRDQIGTDPWFSPFSFQQTWDIVPNPTFFQSSTGPGHVAFVHYDIGSGTPGYSPLTAPIMDFIGLTGPTTSSYGVSKVFEYNGASPPVGSYTFSLGDEVRTSVDLGGGKFLEKYYIRALSGHGPYRSKTLVSSMNRVWRDCWRMPDHYIGSSGETPQSTTRSREPTAPLRRSTTLGRRSSWAWRAPCLSL